MLDYRLRYFSYFGTTESTISDAERRAGITSAYPSVLAGDALPPMADNEPMSETVPVFGTTPQLVVEGQGTVAIQMTPGVQFAVTLSPSEQLADGEHALGLYLTNESAQFLDVTSTTTPVVIPSIMPKGLDAARLFPGEPDLFWLSVDQKNGYIRYGKTYRSVAVTGLQSKVDVGDTTTRPGQFIWVKKLKYISIASTQGTSDVRPDLGQISISGLPIVNDLSPVIAESIELTLEDLAIGTTTSIANLNTACQRLYTNITGPGIQLNDKNFPDFSEALEYSIRTPGKICYEMLKSKASEFGDPMMTYLRITLGLDEGNSPGVPFVMEIWPSGHMSPIHDHGEAFAVIKVLHGKINASYFTNLGEHRIKLEPDVMLEEGNATWLGPDNYQVHQLHNDFDRLCVTIQCYQYANEDTGHDEYFEYLEAGTGEKKPFFPSSDWEFVSFKKQIRAEWDQHLKDKEWK